MPRATLPTGGGQYTNTDAFASGKPEQIVNLMLDESGTLSSRPGLSVLVKPTDTATDVPVRTSQNPQGIVGLHPKGSFLIAVRRNRRVFKIDGAGTSVDITDKELGGDEVPTFLEGDDGDIYILGGGEPLVVGKTFRAKPITEEVTSIPPATHGGIVDRIMFLNEFNTGYFRSSGQRNYTEWGDGINGNSDNPATAFSTSGTHETSSNSDKIEALAAHRDTLYVFGKRSVEVFYPTGDFSSPIRRDSNPVDSEIGASRSLIDADSSLWWVDGNRRIIRLEGRAPKAVSLDIEAQLRGFSDFSDAIGHEVDFDGHHLVTFSSEKAGLTLVYDYVLNVWTEWRRWNIATGQWTSMPMTAYAYHPQLNRHFCGGADDGNVYELKSTTYDDNGSPLRRLWRGPYYDHGTLQRKRNRRLTFLFDGGTATSHSSSDGSDDPLLEVRWRNEDRRWSQYAHIHIGKVGQLWTTRDLWRCGDYARRQIEWSCSASVALRMNRIEEEFLPRTK